VDQCPEGLLPSLHKPYRVKEALAPSGQAASTAAGQLRGLWPSPTYPVEDQGLSSSLEGSACKSAHIIAGKSEPLPIRATIRKPSMPISLDTRCVVGSYRMNQRDRLREGNANLSHAAFELITSPDFVVVA
jgi:hypothetical protein